MKTTLFALCLVYATGTTWSQELPEPSPTPTPPTSSANPSPSTKSSVSWLVGTWVFDEEFTRQKQAELQKNRGSVSAETPGLTSQLVDKMKGARVEVTDSQITMSRPDAPAKTQKFTIVESDDPNTVQLKQENGENLAFHREGDRMWMTSAGSVNEPFYFKKGQ